MQAVKDGRRCTRHMYQQARANEMAMRKYVRNAQAHITALC